MADQRWVEHLRAARARLEPGDPASLLPLATFEQIPALIRRLKELRPEKDVVVWANGALAAGSFDQRMCLHVAMHVAGIYPRPPPSVHQSFDVMFEVDRLTLAYWHVGEE